MKNDLDPVIEYGSSQPSATAGSIDPAPHGRHEPDQDGAADALLPTAQLRQLRMELQQRRLDGKGKIPWRRRLERFFRWLG